MALMKLIFDMGKSTTKKLELNTDMNIYLLFKMA